MTMTGDVATIESQYGGQVDVTANGTHYEGNTIVISEDGVYVDGVRKDELSRSPQDKTGRATIDKVCVTVHGDARSISTQSGDITVHGNTHNASTQSGCITIEGNTHASSTMTGNINVHGECATSPESMTGTVSQRGSRSSRRPTRPDVIKRSVIGDNAKVSKKRR